MTRADLSPWQRRVLADVANLAAAFPRDLRIVGRYQRRAGSAISFTLRLRTADITHHDGGLRLRESEDVIVTVGQTDLLPPLADVGHLRFLGHAHVLQGRRLCLYLDPAREWDPGPGFGGFVDRLTQWLADAAAGTFDAHNALYHAVGGVLHITPGTPTVVIRKGPRPAARLQHAWLRRRRPRRFDLVLDRPPADPDIIHAPFIILDASLPLGAGADLRHLLAVVDDPYCGVPAPGDLFRTRPRSTGLARVVLAALAASAIRRPPGSIQPFVVAVPHPGGGPPHLLAAAVPGAGADHLRALAQANRDRSAMIAIEPTDITGDTTLQWWPVSDERPELTTRRDATRPVAAYAGRTVQIWGCGGLGSWIAEYVVRAGATTVVLCDPGQVTGGLLVRQNYVEADIGESKTEALARRLRSISDTVEVIAHTALATAVGDLGADDLIIDTTVSIAISRLLDAAADSSQRPALAQMATDARTGTLGILTVSMPPLSAGPSTIDQQAGRRVLCDGSLEAFHALWVTTADEELIPTRGCSTPTFHGSTADMAGVAGSLTSILGSHLTAVDPVSGTHLISLPHGEAGPFRTFIDVEPPTPPVEAGAAQRRVSYRSCR